MRWHFPPTGSLGAADTISSPSQFALISLEVKKDHRETSVLKVGFGSASSGTDVVQARLSPLGRQSSIVCSECR